MSELNVLQRGIPCTVVITVSSAGDASYTSLGGVATVVNTSAVDAHENGYCPHRNY